MPVKPLYKKWPLEGKRALFPKVHMENPRQKSGSYSGGFSAQGGGAPPVPPPSRYMFLYRILHMNSLKKCLVAFQWPVEVMQNILKESTHFISTRQGVRSYLSPPMLASGQLLGRCPTTETALAFRRRSP